MIKKEYLLTQPFNKIACADYGELFLSQGDQVSLTIEGDEERLNALHVEVLGESLNLGVQRDWVNQFGKFISSLFEEKNRKVIYYLSVPNLNNISLSGNLVLTCQSFNTNELKLNISGLGRTNFTHLDCAELIVKISGRGEFTAAGRADQQTIKISGSGNYSAEDLFSQNTRIVISGQGNANVNVSEYLDITISGMGQVNYRGKPKVHQVISGFGKSKRLNDA